MTPHTIRWIPSTQTFNSITICQTRNNLFAKYIFVYFWNYDAVAAAAAASRCAAASRHTTKYTLWYAWFFLCSLIFNASHQLPNEKNWLNIIFVQFEASTAFRFVSFRCVQYLLVSAVTLTSFLSYLLLSSLWLFISLVVYCEQMRFRAILCAFSQISRIH